MTEFETQVAYDWGVRAFGHEHMTNSPLRALRLVEEVIELAQAAAVPRDKLLELINIVYSRPVGSLYQEIGGTMVTLLVFCKLHGINPQDALRTEIRRVLSHPAEHFAKRNQEKLELGLK